MSGSRGSAPFAPEFFGFLRELERNNNRPWFLKNKSRYETFVLGPSLAFVEAMGPPLARLSPHLEADARPVGGSLMRIYRDVRFSKDKSPYRTSMGIHFAYRENEGHDGGLPGFFLHLAPGTSFVASGIWGPAPPELARIRTAIVRDPAAWKRAKAPGLAPDDDALKRAPPGFDPGHPLVEDLKRKSFVARSDLSDRDVTATDFPRRFLGDCRRLDPINRFLAKATGLAY